MPLLLFIAACAVPEFDPFADAPACAADLGDGRIDLDTQCADGACAGDSQADWVAALGSDANCKASYAGDSYRCSWENGLTGYFDDDDGDGLPDDAAEAVVVFVDLPYSGTSADGLGLGVSVECFGEALGVPDTLAMERIAGGWFVTEAHYDASHLDIEDSTSPDEIGDPDGLVDALRLSVI